MCTYGGVAALAGSPRGARQIVRILHSMSRLHNLPWHRIISAKGEIAIKDPDGVEQQRQLLEGEGIAVDDKGRIELKRHLWQGEIL